ncbi:hypothetical protein BC938DRAFT_481420 [Jimgerdemannia flammicorona]|uniref:Uncharacterized protein n=1 Tax=Jimgerdemannia flammicorona TaxID=994334 RepID=A0A433R0M5_9FUNG|nr:hypothetical protein BC938DRAFT_481420 [Jimgerdemannia flammicorona]
MKPHASPRQRPPNTNRRCELGRFRIRRHQAVSVAHKGFASKSTYDCQSSFTLWRRGGTKQTGNGIENRLPLDKRLD